VGSFYQVWQWTSVTVSALGIIILGLRTVFLIREVHNPFTVPVGICLFGTLAFFYQLVRGAVNPSNCYGTLPGWSSELDGFLFTADIPAVLSALTLVKNNLCVCVFFFFFLPFQLFSSFFKQVAFYQLEILQPKRLVGARLNKLKIPAFISIALLFALQLIVFTIVNTGNDTTSGAIIVQAVVFLIVFVSFLAFYLYVAIRLFVAIWRSPNHNLGASLTGPMVLAMCAVIGSCFAFAAAGIVLADLTFNSMFSFFIFFCFFSVSDLKNQVFCSVGSFLRHVDDFLLFWNCDCDSCASTESARKERKSLSQSISDGPSLDCEQFEERHLDEFGAQCEQFESACCLDRRCNNFCFEELKEISRVFSRGQRRRLYR
jgi:hypothetical protein